MGFKTMKIRHSGWKWKWSNFGKPERNSMLLFKFGIMTVLKMMTVFIYWSLLFLVSIVFLWYTFDKIYHNDQNLSQWPKRSSVFVPRNSCLYYIPFKRDKRLYLFDVKHLSPYGYHGYQIINWCSQTFKYIFLFFSRDKQLISRFKHKRF